MRISFVQHGNAIFIMIDIKKIWFEGDWLYGEDTQGKVYKQSILWYRRLVDATPEQRNDYELSSEGMHWRCIDEDISFDSFAERDGVEPNAMQRFFLTHRELNIAGVAEMLGMSPSLLREYINGWKTPSAERVNAIRLGIQQYGKSLSAANF